MNQLEDTIVMATSIYIALFKSFWRGVQEHVASNRLGHFALSLVQNRNSGKLPMWVTKKLHNCLLKQLDVRILALTLCNEVPLLIKETSKVVNINGSNSSYNLWKHGWESQITPDNPQKSFSSTYIWKSQQFLRWHKERFQTMHKVSATLKWTYKN